MSSVDHSHLGTHVDRNSVEGRIYKSPYYGDFMVNIDSGIQDKVEAPVDPDAVSFRSAQGRFEQPEGLLLFGLPKTGKSYPSSSL